MRLRCTLAHTRPDGSHRSGGARKAGRPAGSSAGDIRDWAKGNGFEVSERGPVLQQIRAAYATAH